MEHPPVYGALTRTVQEFTSLSLSIFSADGDSEQLDPWCIHKQLADDMNILMKTFGKDVSFSKK